MDPFSETRLLVKIASLVYEQGLDQSDIPTRLTVSRSFVEQDDDPVISTTLAQFKVCPTVIALAGGQPRVEALRGAIAGGYIDVLITDCRPAAGLARR